MFKKKETKQAKWDRELKEKWGFTNCTVKVHEDDKHLIKQLASELRMKRVEAAKTGSRVVERGVYDN